MKSGDIEPSKPFDYNSPKDVRGVLVDISTAFKKAWHEGLIFKLKTYCWAKIDYALGKLLKTEKPKKGVVLNGFIYIIMTYAC